MQLEMRLSKHPRARVGIRRAKGAAGLAFFLIVALLSVRAGLPWPDVAIRGLLGGIIAYFVAWGIAVTIWRQIALVELEDARARREARLESLLEHEAMTAELDPS